jgi:iron complex outermembrane recepter protein
MKKFELLSATALALFAVNPAFAQTAPQAADDAATAEESGEIIVTAQRSNQTLQSVPIAVSAFSAKSLDAQQIRNTSDLQLTLPNITFTKTTFTSSSFTIRGVGDLCTGTSCDQATGIHVNGSPVASTRLFESELFDMERVEVLRGPQGTLFGRNATAGVVNFISAKPDLSGFHASAEGEYGNFNYYKVKGMVNVPIGETLAVRVAGYYTKRDGYTLNLFDNSRVDGRDMYGLRASLRWQPSPDTTIDFMGYYFREKDNRLRVQKTQCHRDPTGVLGCLPDALGNDKPNSASGLTGTLTSRETYRVIGQGTALAPFFSSLGLGTLYNPTLATDFYGNNPILPDPRQIYTDYNPTYYAKEEQYQARLDHNFGKVSLQVTGMYQLSTVDSTVDSDQSVVNRALISSAPTLAVPSGLGLAALATAQAGGFGPTVQAFLTPAYNALTPTGPAGLLCTSVPNAALTGVFGGSKTCNATPLNFDRSAISTKAWSAEAILTSHLDGPVNFLVGGIYNDVRAANNIYQVSAFLQDYASALVGFAQSISRAPLGVTPGYLGSPYFNNDTPDFSLKSYGLFGEAYWQMNDQLKLTLGVRYNNDKKSLSSRQTFLSTITPYSAASVTASPYFNGFNAGLPNTAFGAPHPSFRAPFDADADTPCSSTPTPITGVVTATVGCEAFQNRNVSFSALTGRVVLDYKISPGHLLYLSYSRGYKSGGVNPPLGPQFAGLASTTFRPEFINAFEIGSKNTWGKFTLNASAFYYKYQGLQLARIINRNAVNDNVNADIYGLELESVLRPNRNWAINMTASYLKTKVTGDLFIANTRDPSAGRSDVVIVKEITEAFNCVVTPTTAGNAAGANALVNTINNALQLNPAGPFPTGSGITANGAFSSCGTIQAAIAGNIGFAGAALAPLQAILSAQSGVVNGAALPFTYVTGGIAQNIRGNELPGAPSFKWNVGAQYTAFMDNGMTLTPRVDLIYTGDSFGNIFGGNINRIRGYEQINAQVQLNGKDDRWFVKAFVQNLTDNSATTGLTVADQGQGLFTNIFTLEPRRYGLSAGIKF